VVVPDTVGDRYGTFQFISWWDQARLRAATAMVVGAGALGNEVLKNLALMGLGRLFIVDFDRVEPGNLSRTVLFRASDGGRSKVEAAAEAVKALNPDVQVQAWHGDVNTDLGLGVLRRMDVLIGCLDNREARLTLNSYAYRLNMPWVDGAIQELLGIARVFWPGRGACYECTLTPADWEAINLRYSCTLLSRERLLEGKVPTTPTISSIIGAMQAQEALKLLHGLEVQAGHGFIFNGLTNQAYITRYPQRADCLNHESAYDAIEELPQATAAQTTLQQMLDLARARLGPEARLELDYELVTEFYCPACGQRAAVFQPLRRLDGRQAQCPHCGRQRQAITTHTLTGKETYLERTLAEIGIPPLHILTARSGRQYAHLELTGDAASYFRWH
jgi:adenylyltransferase/sulfurtransferase